MRSVKLKPIEAQVLECIRKGMTPMEIAKVTDRNRGFVSSIVATLSELNVIDRTKKLGEYRILVNDYEVLPPEQINRHDKAKPKIDVSDEVRYYIKMHYDKIPRREIARRLRMDKVTLNLVLIEMRMGS